MAVRPVRALERQGLLSLWETVFCDGVGFVNSFLDGTGVEVGGFAAVENGVTAAAAYTVGGISVGGVPYTYIYAVSTLPEFRGHGLGAEVSEACAAEAESRGGVPALHPAEPSLFAWYAKQGFSPAFTAREAEIAPSVSSAALRELSPEEYAAERRRALEGCVFAEFAPALLAWWRDAVGGHFVGFDGGCAAFVPSDGRVFIPEFIASERAAGAAGAISRGQSALIRSPAVRGFAGFGDERDFIAARGGVSGGYWGLVFD